MSMSTNGNDKLIITYVKQSSFPSFTLMSMESVLILILPRAGAKYHEPLNNE